MRENEAKRCCMRSLSYWSNKTLESNMSLNRISHRDNALARNPVPDNLGEPPLLSDAKQYIGAPYPHLPLPSRKGIIGGKEGRAIAYFLSLLELK